MYDTIDYSVEADVATLRLNRPERFNSLNAVMRRELLEALGQAFGESRAVLLTGAGEAFCAGQDLGDVDPARGADLHRLLTEEYGPLVRAIVQSPVPVVCAVNGVAAGAGANLALSADIVLAARSARFIQAFARIGLVPDAGGTYWLPRLVGLPRAMAMALLAEEVDGATAAQWGLVWRAVTDDVLYDEARDVAAHLAKGPTQALRRIRHAMRRGLEQGLSAQLELEAGLQQECAESADFIEGVSAFLERRRPDFRGE